MRRLVFIGNCQIQTLSQLYQRFSDREGEEQIFYLPSYEALNEERRAKIADADVIVEQRQDLPPRVDVGDLGGNAERHFVPMLAGGFLWPFAGPAHPRNEMTWFMPAGPYGGEMSDSYLNRLIAKGVPPEAAVDQYLALDVNSARNLDRLLELILDRQRSRDVACGYQFADLIEERFRDEPVFRTPYHPNLWLTLRFASQFFQHMRLSAAAVTRLHEQLRVTPFPKIQLPIHPSVARHFNLPYANDQTRYRINYDGRFTFAEFAARYMSYEWNAGLAEGIGLAARDHAQALPKLETGLQTSPDSAQGWLGYAEALRRSGRQPEAETAVRRALAIEDPDGMAGRYHNELGHILADLGRLDEAAQATEAAVASDPFDPHVLGFAANVAMSRGQLTEAETLASRAIRCGPANPHLHNLLGDILLRQERPAEAIAAIRRAIAAAPDRAGFHLTLSHALVRAGRMPEALGAARNAVALDPDNAGIQGHLANLLARSADAPDAETHFQALLAANPGKAGLQEQYGHLLARLGRVEDAEAAFRRAIDLAPESAGPLAGLSHALTRLGRHQDALAAVEAAIGFSPRFAPFHVHRGNLLRILAQNEAASAAYRVALALDPANQDAAQRLRALGEGTQAAG